MNRLVAVDVETAQPCDHVVELALVEIIDGVPSGREFVSRFKPTSTMNHFCQKVHGIRLRDLDGEPFFAQRVAEILDFVGDSDLVAHNKSTEEKTLAKEFARIGLPPWPASRFHCTMQKAKEAGIPRKLREACATVGIPVDHLGTRHTAIEDTRLCALLFARLSPPGLFEVVPSITAPVAPGSTPTATVVVPPEEKAAIAPVEHTGPHVFVTHVRDVEPAPGEPPGEPVVEVDGTPGSLTLKLVALPSYGLACQRGNVPLVHALTVENAGDRDLDGVSVVVATDPPITLPFRVECDRIGARTSLDVPCSPLPSPSYLEGVEESLPAVLTVTLVRGSETLATASRPFRVLARDEWPGTATNPELLAAFVRPNERSVDGLLRAASMRLREAGRDGSLEGYAKGDRARSWEIAEGIYLALSDLGLTYALPPASFERRGQKIRTPSAIVGDRLATCLDTTLLYASCIEQAGLRPVLVLVQGHALCAVWLARETFGQCLVDDPGALRRHVAAGDLVMVETTFLTQRVGFSDAVRVGYERLEPSDAFEMAIDVATARVEGVLPLETGAAGTPVGGEHEAPEAVPFGVPPELEAGLVEPEPESGDRLSSWLRKLLDLSLRNRLLNHRDGKGSLPLLVGDLPKIEDALAAGEEVLLRPRAPTTIPADRPDLLRAAHRAIFEEYRSVDADLGPGDFEKRLSEVERAARTNLAEGGSNTLFLTLGFLEWIPAGTAKGKTSRAPLILLPVAISGTGAGRRPRLTLLSEETRFNPALAEMLKQDFRIAVPTTLPRDASGVHVAAVFQQVRIATAHMAGWSVDDGAVALTTFSFTKFLMWKDLEERTEEIRESRTARLLLDGFAAPEGPGGTDVEREHVPDSVPPGSLYMPLPADASQVAAVMGAQAGESFVMIGPPGTGKSQTIANIIANSLAHGRTVLFVSQKTAALQAVSRRLEDVGLGAHCLEVHSTKSGRNEVLGQMLETWRSAAGGDTNGHAAVAEEVRDARDRLNDFVGELHAPNANGLTAHSAIARSVRARLSGAPVTLDFTRLPDDHAAWLAAARKSCRDVEDMLATFPDPASHPLADVTATVWGPAMPGAVAADAAALVDAVTSLLAGVEALREAFGVTLGEGRDAYEAVARLSGRLTRPEAHVGRAYLTSATVRSSLSRAGALGKELEDHRRKLKATYAKGALALDLEALSARWEEASRKGFLGRTLGRRAVRKAVAPFAGGTAPADLGPDLGHLREMARLHAEVSAILAAAPVPKAFLKDGLVNQVMEERAKAWALEMGADIKLVASRSLREMAAALGRPELTPLLESVTSAYDGFLEVEGRLLGLVGATALVDGEWLAATVERAERWSGASARLNAWCSWKETEGQARGLGLGALVDAVSAGTVPANGVSEAFESAYAVWFAERLIGTRPLLRTFVRSRHEALIERFKEADERLMVETRTAVAAILAGRVPSHQATAAMPEWLQFQAQAQAGPRQRAALPLRQVFERAPGPLRVLAPCMMMSPLSVAQYMPVTSRFDLVIFDEASQVTPWDALGALARGRQAIVVGDPKQLPPTDAMFAMDGDAGDAVDGISPESVLDACFDAGMRRRYLRWHYRSRHESLIAFSKAYYYPEMLSFPSPVTRDSAVRVEFVEDAAYDKGARVNQVEARAVVDDVVRRLTDPATVARGPSIGIVTFNGPQMILIEEMLLDERRRRPEIDPFFDSNRPDHVFVKNLENVQGDERDVILFSVTFARAPGRGPLSVVSNLNKVGGERRLNVAITRAREEMVLFTALRSVDVAPSAALGVTHFKAFLDYAERGPQALAQAGAGPERIDSVLEAEILKGLRAMGWEVNTQVGVSGYRIDLGVVNPLDRGRYLAGVECDGATYHRAASARDRDKLRQAILERLGWRIRRVWSTDWWHDPKGCLRELHEALRADVEDFRVTRTEASEVAEGSPDEVVTPMRRYADPVRVDQADRSAPETDDDGDEEVAPGPGADLVVDQSRFFEASYRPILRRHVAAIIEAEWPVFQDDVVARVVAMHGFRRQTRQMVDAVVAAIERRFVRTRDGDRIVRWLGKEHVAMASPFREKDRTASYADVPLPRLVDLARSKMAGEDDARTLRLMADALGIDRISGAAKDRLQNALDVARRNAVDREGVAA